MKMNVLRGAADCGALGPEEDGLRIEVSVCCAQRLAARMKSNGIKPTFRELQGRHSYSVWRQCFSGVAPLLFQR